MGTSEGFSRGSRRCATVSASVPRDCRPLFDPIDYVAFNGLALHGEVKSITFLDVKTGGGGLNPRQRQIRAVVEAGKVEWQEYSIETRP